MGIKETVTGKISKYLEQLGLADPEDIVPPPEFPVLSAAQRADLFAWLEWACPDKLPSEDEPLESIRKRQMRREVANLIIRTVTKQATPKGPPQPPGLPAAP